ncbi:MAG TPA: 16S rRNA (guanine(527)-N(7))-methyltransferase RsmG [Stellaceae bacterium]|nr:16S rRNA (guanine(527)-N(7))-methyltransferase RsmG [Stellaceae bacterium]
MSGAAPSRAPLDAAGFAAASGVSRETLARLEAYRALLAEWSRRINLVAGSTLDDVWRRHFLDSAQLLPLVPRGAQSLIDLGSGAGFPGLVLAILGVAQVELVEADARKCAFLREAARVAQAPVRIHNSRIESLPPRPFDVVTARGCAPLDRLLVLAQPFVAPGTRCLFPKGEQAGQELAAAQQHWKFDVTSQQSRSDPRGVILCLSGVARREPGDGG